jgi:acyl carrier protein
MNQEIWEIINSQGKMSVSTSTLSDDDDLYEYGLTSHATVNVMLALEDAFDIEFPDRMLRKSTFESVAAIHAALIELGVIDET